ncbi:MAG: hypothetical protein ACJA1L_001368 [Paracoccaceae bacterium]|jgi:uncharacterized protein YbcC (UPF0753/DUF2309 family)
MFDMNSPIAPALTSLSAAVRSAIRAIPPAFPLDATVAVNPFLGQASEGLAVASARLARVAGARVTPPRADHAQAIADGRISDADLAAAWAACASPLKPADPAVIRAEAGRDIPAPTALPTVADLAAQAGGTDWPAVIARSVGLWAAGHFDRGQALWSPAPGKGAYAAWRDWATHDLTPEIAGLTGFCAHVATAPDSAERAIARAADRLAIAAPAAETVFHRLLCDLGGWAQHARWLLWQAELLDNDHPAATDLLAIRLVWEEALLAHAPAVAHDWAETVAAHAAPVAPTRDQVIDAVLQDAAERGHQRRLGALLSGETAPAPARPAMQAAFCIDVRSEVMRRALEGAAPDVATVGVAGFFGLGVAHRPFGSDVPEARLPALLTPGLSSCATADPGAEQASRIAARTARAWGRFRQAAVSSFAFVEAAGPFYAGKLVKDALALGAKPPAPAPAPQIDGDLSQADRAATAAAALRAMSLTEGHARLVLLVGHGAHLTNNPHESAYRCGACGGHGGDVSARLLAAMLNDPETRALLPAQGIALPADTVFVAGLHDTATDEVTLFLDAPAPEHDADIAEARDRLARAGAAARAERARRLPGATADTVAARAANWAETRPEWGLAGCAAFIAAPRAATAGRDLGGRAFLHSYDWRTDDGFATLEMIMTAPVVVASWISLQYYGSSVAPDTFGGGDKLIHNVVGGIGVVEGNGGALRAGLPWQAVHDGAAAAHDPLRLSVLVEAPQQAIADVLARHEGLRALVDNGWLHLLSLQDGRIDARWRPGLGWETPAQVAA